MTVVATRPSTSHFERAKEEATAALTAPIMNTLPTASAALFVVGVVTLPLGVGAVLLPAAALMAPIETVVKVATSPLTTPVSAALHGAKAIYHLARAISR